MVPGQAGTDRDATDMTASVQGELADGGFKVHVRDLLDDWFDRQQRPGTFRMGRLNHQTNEGQFALVYAYCAHVHGTARAYLAAVEAGPVLVATPLARMCFETALTAQWIAQTPDGYRSVSNEEIRQRIGLVRAMRDSANEVFQQGAEHVTHADVAQRLASDSDASARNFKQLCDDLTPGGAEAYAIYRAMSMESHPSVLIADQWIDGPSGDGRTPSLRTRPRESRTEDSWMYLTAASLVWAGRALDYFDREHIRRSLLRRAAREIGCAETLQLSEHYRQRVRRARRIRRSGQGDANSSSGSDPRQGGGARP